MIAPLGVVMTIFTIDEIATKLVAPPPFKPIKCTVCGKITYAKEEKEEEIDELLREKN